jgi:hypothetical protein
MRTFPQTGITRRSRLAQVAHFGYYATEMPKNQ